MCRLYYRFAYFDLFFFFFQAEDGIRDWSVTGVQTCALPIFGSVGLQFALRNRDRVDRIALLNAPIASDAKLPFKMQQMTWPLIGDMLTQDPLDRKSVV